jgi:hypothetical protein
MKMLYATCRGLERRLADALTVGSGPFLPPTPGTEGHWGDVLPCAACRDLARQLQKHGLDGQGIGKTELRMIKKHLMSDVDAAASAAAPTSAGDSDITRGFQEDAVRLRARIAELEMDNAAQLAQRWHIYIYTCIYIYIHTHMYIYMFIRKDIYVYILYETLHADSRQRS